MRSMLVALLFAALLLALAPLSPLLAESPPRLPQLRAQVEDRVVPLELERLDIAIRIHGFLAETSLEMTFHNPEDRELEGEFVLALPDHAIVSGYGLDVDGVMVDGVVVEKEKARVIFEQETREQIDPGLVEWLEGNLFRTRVYPIFAGSRRTIRLQYLERLEFRARRALYRLPLQSTATLEHVGLELEILGPDRRPRIRRHPFARLEPSFRSGTFSARTIETETTLGRDLEIELRAAGRTIAMAEQVETAEGEGWVFAAADFGRPSAKESVSRESKAGGPKPEKWVLFWDASFSRQEVDPTRAFELLEALLRRWRPRSIALVVFGDRAAAPVIFDLANGDLAAGDPTDLLAALGEQVYDGATTWRDLEIPADFEADGVLLFGDGRLTLDSARIPDFGVPTWVFSTSEGAHHRLLRHLASKHGGAYFDLAKESPEGVLAALERSPTALRSVDVEGGRLLSFEAPINEPIGGPTIVTGLLDGPRAVAKLRYTSEAGEQQSRTVRIRQGLRSGLVARFRAQQRIDRLALFPDAHREELLGLARAHGLVTPVSSLLVLEELGQYLFYGVEPPASRPEMLEDYRLELEEMRQDSRDIRAEHREMLEEQWQDYLGWYQRSFDFPPAGSLAPPEPAPPSTSTAAPSTAASSTEEAPPLRPARGRPPADPFARLPNRVPSVRGVVSDEDGQPLPGVMITFESAALGSPRQVIANEWGAWVSPILTPGSHIVRFELEGFTTVENTFELRPGQILRLDAALPFSAVEEAIMVTSEAYPESGGEGQSEILLRPWTPDVPYLPILEAASDAELYRVYLEQRRTYGNSPAFFVDAARHFAGRSRHEESARIVSNLLELAIEDPRLIRVVADQAARTKDWDRAVLLRETLTELRPELPQSDRDLALALIHRGDQRRQVDPEAARQDYGRAAELLRRTAFEPWGSVSDRLQWIYLDSDRFEDISPIALTEYHWAVAKLHSISAVDPPASEDPVLDAQWTGPVAADLRIELSWDDEFADMDLWVHEPTGEKVDYRNPKSEIGGFLSDDCTTGLGPEIYTLREAMPGTYRISVDYYSNSTPQLLGPVTVRLRVTTGFGTTEEVSELRIIRLDSEEDTMEIGTVEIGGEETDMGDVERSSRR